MSRENVECDSLFDLFLETKDNDEMWLEEDINSMFSVFNIDDFVMGAKIAIYISIGLVTLSLLCLPSLRALTIKRRERLSLSIRNDLEMTTVKPTQSSKSESVGSGAQRVGHAAKLFCVALFVYISVATLIVITYIPGYFVGAHVYDSYDSFVEVGCIAFNCTENKKYDYNISACSQCMDDIYDYDACVIWQFDVESLCDMETSPNYTDIMNARFYGTFIEPNRGAFIDSQRCFMNKDNFKVRSGNCCHGDCCSEHCCYRCGVCFCKYGCCKCCCWNCCGYSFVITCYFVGLLCLIFAIFHLYVWRY